MFKTITVKSEESCKVQCYHEHNCQSYNARPSLPAEEWLCELSNADEKQHPASFKSKAGFKYRATKVTSCNVSDCLELFRTNSSRKHLKSNFLILNCALKQEAMPR